MEPTERIERDEEELLEEEDEEAEEEDAELAALEYEDLLSQSPTVAPTLAKKPAPAPAPPPPVDPALSAQMCVMLKEQGNEHFKAGRYDAALRAYERAVEHDTSNPHLWLNIAAALLKLDRTHEALWNSNRALVLTSGKNAKAWYRRACALQQLGHLSCALADATEAAVLEPMDAGIIALERQLTAQLNKERLEAEKDPARDESAWFDLMSAYNEGAIANAVFAGEEKLHLSAFAYDQEKATPQASFSFTKKAGLASALTAALYLLRSNEQLTDLDLSDLPISDIRVTVALGEFLKKNTKVNRLNLTNTSIGPFGAQMIATALPVSPIPLAHLALDGCVLGFPGATALARALGKYTRLKSLSLASASLRDTGAAAIARALAMNEKLSLTHLSLAANYIDGRCADDLAALAERHHGLCVDLSRNPFVPERIVSLLKTLPADAAKFKCDGLSQETSAQLAALASPLLLSAVPAACVDSGRPSSSQPLY